MRHVRSIGLIAALLVFLPVALHAQTVPWFGQPYQYRDADGIGTLTITPLSAGSTKLSFQPVRVMLLQNGVLLGGSGVYHSFPDDQAGLPNSALVAFTLVAPSGQSYLFQGTISVSAGTPTAVVVVPAGGYTVTGTYSPVTSPQTTFPWSATAASSPAPFTVTNATPALVDHWNSLTFAEAIGGSYVSTFNAFDAAVSTAAWSGSLPMSGRYKVEAFIPRQLSSGLVPRTSHAVYNIAQFGTGPVLAIARLATISQAVNTSQWVELGTFSFSQGYRITLTDVTEEPKETRSVVANAVRLTFVSP